MSSPAVGAKYVAALVVGVVGAGTFAGVSHDGRGGEPPADPEPIVEAPLSSAQPSAPTTTTAATATAPVSPSVTSPAPTAAQVESTQPALPATPDPVPTRARVRSRGS